jgi:hypothetical protein
VNHGLGADGMRPTAPEQRQRDSSRNADFKGVFRFSAAEIQG